MRDFRERQKMRRALYSRVTLGLLVIILLVLIRATWGIYQKAHETSVARRQSEAVLKDLSDRQAFLEQEIGRLETPTGVESEIRKRFGVAKDGEKVIILVDQPTSTASSTNETSWWQRFLGWF